MNIQGNALYATVSATASAVDGVLYDTTNRVGASAFLGTMAEMMLKMMNRITSMSCTLVSGGSAGGVAVAFPTVTSNDGGINGLYHGVPFRISAAGTISGQPGSAVSTTSTTIRRVLVGLSLGDISAVTSSIASGVGTLTFVIGAPYTISVANAASTGGVSAWFNQVPLPKYSAGLVPVGVINVPTSCTGSAGLSNTCLTFPLRELYGFDMSAIIGNI